MSGITRTRVLVFLSFVIAFAAGVSLGAVVSRPKPRPRGRGLMAEQLHLNADQQKQMRQIWSDLMQQMRANGEKRRALTKERQDALRALLATPELQAKYDAIVKEYDQKLSDLAQEGGKAREEANRRTLAILTDAQRAKFEEFMKSQGTRRPRGDDHGRGRHGPRPGQGPPQPAGAGPAGN